jgi:hypothetical protein
MLIGTLIALVPNMPTPPSKPTQAPAALAVLEDAAESRSTVEAGND